MGFRDSSGEDARLPRSSWFLTSAVAEEVVGIAKDFLGLLMTPWVTAKQRRGRREGGAQLRRKISARLRKCPSSQGEGLTL